MNVESIARYLRFYISIFTCFHTKSKSIFTLGIVFSRNLDLFKMMSGSLGASKLCIRETLYPKNPGVVKCVNEINHSKPLSINRMPNFNEGKRFCQSFSNIESWIVDKSKSRIAVKSVVNSQEIIIPLSLFTLTGVSPCRTVTECVECLLQSTPSNQIMLYLDIKVRYL